MPTIARTATRKIAAIKAENLRVLAYTLRSNFIPFEADADYVWNLVAEGRGKLETVDAGYQVHVHSNEWYRLVPRETVTDADRRVANREAELAHVLALRAAMITTAAYLAGVRKGGSSDQVRDLVDTLSFRVGVLESEIRDARK